MTDRQRKQKPDDASVGEKIGSAIGGAIGGAIDVAGGAVRGAGRVIGSALHRSSAAPHEKRPSYIRPGAPPGLESIDQTDVPPPPGAVRITVTDCGAERHDVRAIDVAKLEPELSAPRPEGTVFRWVNIDGLHANVIKRMQELFKFHTLAAEDVHNVPQRPRVEPYDDHLFIVTRMLMVRQEHLHSEQITMFVYEDTLITFQETHGDVWGPVRQRMAKPASRFRSRGVQYLLYALLDALVDHAFPILEKYGDELEDVELALFVDAKPRLFRQLHTVKRDLLAMRRIAWPMRQLVDELYRDDDQRLTDDTKTYLRDVQDHAVQLIDIIETYREMSGGLCDLYMSMVSNKMNEVMKVLTIMASLFIPTTFIAGVYGMNFDHLPETHWRGMYPWGFWAICLAIVVAMLTWFWRKGWLGRS